VSLFCKLILKKCSTNIHAQKLILAFWCIFLVGLAFWFIKKRQCYINTLLHSEYFCVFVLKIGSEMPTVPSQSSFLTPSTTIIAMYRNTFLFGKQTGFSDRYSRANPRPIGLKFNMKLSFEPKFDKFLVSWLPSILRSLVGTRVYYINHCSPGFENLVAFLCYLFGTLSSHGVWEPCLYFDDFPIGIE
jgi:hypothetical protein